MALSSPVLRYDFICVCMDERGRIQRSGAFGDGSVIYASVMDCRCQRGDDAAAVSLLVLAGAQRKQRISAVDGSFQSIGVLCGFVSGKKLSAGWRIPDRLYERTDEREHGDLVCGYGRVELLPIACRKEPIGMIFNFADRCPFFKAYTGTFPTVGFSGAGDEISMEDRKKSEKSSVTFERSNSGRKSENRFPAFCLRAVGAF